MRGVKTSQKVSWKALVDWYRKSCAKIRLSMLTTILCPLFSVHLLHLWNIKTTKKLTGHQFRKWKWPIILFPEMTRVTNFWKNTLIPAKFMSIRFKLILDSSSDWTDIFVIYRHAGKLATTKETTEIRSPTCNAQTAVRDQLPQKPTRRVVWRRPTYYKNTYIVPFKIFKCLSFNHLWWERKKATQ